MVSPHFPPDSSAAAHRVRLLAPHLPEFGWEPTVLTVDPRDYEGRLDPALEALVPESLRVVRVRALPARYTRLVRVGDLGLRSFYGLWSGCRELLEAERFDCLFVTIFPSYPALLGPLLKRKKTVPFVLDYQDPWVGSWGLTSGAGVNGAPDVKSRLSRTVAARLEPLAVRAADGLTAVSEETLRQVQTRIQVTAPPPWAEIPLGAEASDFALLRSRPRPNSLFDATDGRFHLSYVGTLLPLGYETLRAFLRALVLLKERAPRGFRNLSVHFVGTGNQTLGSNERVLPEARALGVESAIQEIPNRLDYLDALQVLVDSDAILLLGSSEPHYTASKLFPALLAGRPLLALFHRSSTVTGMLESVPGSLAQVVTYDEAARAESRVEAVYEALSRLLDERPRWVSSIAPPIDAALSARSMAMRLAHLLDRVANGRNEP
jgi:glycosyltransferase involved in cell wall biosynthesis